MNDTILNVPISINGGNDEPLTLDERELYVQTTTGNLYCGLSGNSVSKINSGYSDATKSVITTTLNVSTTDALKIGDANGLKWDSTLNVLTAINDVTKDKTYTLQYPDLSEILGMRLSNKGSYKTYGTVEDMNNIKTPQEGQLFFVVE